MLAAHSPISGNQIHRPKTARKPLQPKNSPATPIDTHLKSKQDARQWNQITVADESNKENVPPLFATAAKTDSCDVEPFDASLAEELSAIREKLQRLRQDKEKTEKNLGERDMMLDVQMKELLRRGEEQKQLEIEVDRLFRLKELRLACMRISPIRSLREKVVKPKKMDEDQLQETSSIGIEQSKDGKLVNLK